MASPSQQRRFVFKNNFMINPEWFEKPSYLKGDLAIIRVPDLKTTKNIKPLELPKPPYYPNGMLQSNVKV